MMIEAEVKQEASQKSICELTLQDTAVLKSFQTDNGKILPRKYTRLTAREQRHVTNMIKRARSLLLLK